MLHIKSVFRIGLGVLLGAMVVGCGKADSGGAKSDAGGTEPATAKSGYVTGRITLDGGKPIAVAGAKINFSFHGIASKSAEKVNYTPKVNADGSYEQKVVDGTYAFSMQTIDVPYDGQHFVLQLEPVGDDQTNRDSDKGIVQDYVWKLQGLRPGQTADESNFTHWHGGSVTMVFSTYREDTKKSVKSGPATTKCVFTLTPKGKQIDGSDGKAMTYSREYDSLLGGLKNNNLQDMPIGIYTLTGEEVAADGKKTPLVVRQPDLKSYGPSLEIHFTPSATGVWPTQVSFTRDE